jgi:hypothetical protein
LPRKRKSNALTSIDQDVKRLRKQSRELLKKANKDLKSYRSEIRALKKQGIVSKKIDPRTQRPTKYMLSKIRRFGDVIRGDVNAVKASPDQIRQYTEKGLLEARGNFLIVPKDSADQTARMRKGLVAKYRPLKNGQERKVILPYRATDLEQLAHQIKDNAADIDKMKEPTEQFGFQLYGHNSLAGEPDAERLAEYILRRYAHMFKRKDSLKEFVLIRFKNKTGHPLSPPLQGEKKYSPGRKLDMRDPRDRMIMEQRQESNRKRVQRTRMRESEAQREKRLAANRIRARQWRQKQLERKIFDD